MTSPPAPPPGSYPPPPDDYPPPPPAYYPYPAGAYPYPPGGYAYPAPLPPQAYTPWLTRVAAYLIDSVPIAALVFAGQMILLATASTADCADTRYSGTCTAQPSGLGLTLMVLFSFAALGFWIWNYGYRQGTTGSSVGKSIMKFAVVAESTGRPIGFGMSVVRQFAHFLDSILCNLGYLFPLWDAKRQTIADKVMSTVCRPQINLTR
jgi:uncharacterized RDD family membrane protein YckC